MAPRQSLHLHSSSPDAMSCPEPGLRRQVMSNTPELMLVRHTMDAGWVGVRHSHPHQQLLYVVSGRIHLQTDIGDLDLRAGDSTIIPGNIQHQATAPVASEVLDVFTPTREDYA